jgi:hypothetical protein
MSLYNLEEVCRGELFIKFYALRGSSENVVWLNSVYVFSLLYPYSSIPKKAFAFSLSGFDCYGLCTMG